MNIFEMHLEFGKKPGFWIRKDTWKNTIAKVTQVGGSGKAELVDGKRVAHADVYDAHTGQLKTQNVSITTPDADEVWRWVQAPPWSDESIIHPLDGRQVLEVSYDDRDLAKKIGAHWSPLLSAWWMASDDHVGLRKAEALGFFSPPPPPVNSVTRSPAANRRGATPVRFTAQPVPVPSSAPLAAVPPIAVRAQPVPSVRPSKQANKVGKTSSSRQPKSKDASCAGTVAAVPPAHHINVNGPIYFDVDYERREEARAAGAHWKPEIKKWAVDASDNVSMAMMKAAGFHEASQATLAAPILPITGVRVPNKASSPSAAPASGSPASVLDYIFESPVVAPRPRPR